MNEKMKKTMKRSLALMLALILAIGTGTWMRDGRLKADEEAPEAEVVVEEAAPAEAPAPAPVEEPVVVVQQVEFTPEPPAAAEPAAEEKQEAEAEQQVEESAPAEEPVVSEEEQEAEQQVEEASEDDADASFDVEEAYEYYMSLGSEAEKQAYLESLDSADRAELERYIAEKEAEAEAIEVEAAGRSAEAVEEAEPVEQGTAAGRSAEEEAEAEAEADKAEAEAPEDTSFGSAKVSGEWSGRDTSGTRSLSVEVYVDGELADSCYTEMNKSVAKFSIALGGCTVESESSSCGAFSGSNGSYTVDMYADTSATVTIRLLAPVVESFTVRFFDFDGVQIGEDQTVKSGEAAVAPEVAPVSEEHEFTGWDVNFECVTSDLDIYPRIEAAPVEDAEAEEPEEDKEEKTKHTVSIWFEYISETEEGYGTVVGLYSKVEGFEDDIGYQWQYSTDDANWLNIPGATDSTYTYTVDETNIEYFFRLTVNGN